MLTLRRVRPADASGSIRGNRLRAAAASVVIHALVVVGLWQVLQFPRTIGRLFSLVNQPAPERIRFLTVPPAPEVRRPIGVPDGSDRPARAPTTPERAAPRPDVLPPPPAEVPTSLPPPPVSNGPAVGPLASGRGPVKGIQPGYTEPRIWVEPSIIEPPALTGDAKLDSAVAARIIAYRDSVLANTYVPNKFERGEWVYETKDGKKFGIDKQFIRLGKFSIPTALLGLLPLNQQGNPIAYDRDRRLAAMRADILEHAQAAMNEEEFRVAVKSIRDRKEKERKALLEKKKKEPEKVISERVPR